MKLLYNETLMMNFLTFPPTARQVDGEYDSFVALCVCARKTDRQRQRERKIENKREEEVKGGGEGWKGEKWEER